MMVDHIFGLAYTLVAPLDTTKEEKVMAISISRDEVQRLIREEAAQLVEVLPPPMFEDEHIEGAINISLKELDRETTRRLDEDRPVIVY